MTYINQLRDGIKNVLKNILGFRPSRIAIEVDNKVYYFTEYELRALQVMVKNMTDAEFEEFNQRVVIYNGAYKRYSKPVNICRDGYLDEPIKIFSAISKLSQELL
jgi:hypothetical protein